LLVTYNWFYRANQMRFPCRMDRDQTGKFVKLKPQISRRRGRKPSSTADITIEPIYNKLAAKTRQGSIVKSLCLRKLA
jgi:hypothetical protein